MEKSLFESAHGPVRRVVLVIGQARFESLCHRLLAAARSALEEGGSETRVHDLLADGFDPVLRLPPGEAVARAELSTPLARRYQEDVTWMDALVVVHPVWWFAPPAILKGWVDQVLVRGIAFDQGGRTPRPLLRGRRALLIQTFNAPRVVDRVLMRGLSEAFWRRAVFSSVGIRRVRRVAFHGVEGASLSRVAEMESEVEKAARGLLE